jgi:phosphatidylglycerophosphate synthase
MQEIDLGGARRPLRSRDTAWARWLASYLVRSGVRPNTISLASVAFAAAGGLALLIGPACPDLVRGGLLIFAAVCIQIRLLCNLLDGMVAIEGGGQSRSGMIYNELPDRFADLLLLVPAGYSVDAPWPWGPIAGWICAVFALLTAYVRVLGTNAGTGADYSGPMAKQHRMAALTIGCLFSTLHIARPSALNVDWLFVALCLIAVGTAITVYRRTLHVLEELGP